MSQAYEIRVEESLDPHWSAWFGGMEIIPLAGPDPARTLIRGSLPDLAALYGVLSRMRDLNLNLVEVRRVA